MSRQKARACGKTLPSSALAIERGTHGGRKSGGTKRLPSEAEAARFFTQGEAADVMESVGAPRATALRSASAATDVARPFGMRTAQECAVGMRRAGSLPSDGSRVGRMERRSPSAMIITMLCRRMKMIEKALRFDFDSCRSDIIVSELLMNLS
ncbi:hypothetical protein MRX96_024379 [Rhipicephalus microplus]